MLSLTSISKDKEEDDVFASMTRAAKPSAPTASSAEDDSSAPASPRFSHAAWLDIP